MSFKGQDRAAVRALPVKELQAQLKETEDKFYKFKFANSFSRLKNGHEIAHLRKHRARLVTWIREKEIQGVKGAKGK